MEEPTLPVTPGVLPRVCQTEGVCVARALTEGHKLQLYMDTQGSCHQHQQKPAECRKGRWPWWWGSIMR